MSIDKEQDTTEITSIQQLTSFFSQGEKPLHARRIGTEHEKFVFRHDRQGTPLIQFKDERGIEEIFSQLSDRFGWEPLLDDGHLLTLTKDQKSISLEPAGQLELSGAPLTSIHETKEEVTQHLEELSEIAGEFTTMTSFGLNPYAIGGELPWMPRNRYQIMRRYMAKQGPLGHWMMQTTCTIQANLDYTSEADAADIVHTSVLISPIVNAIFSNSPIVAHQPTSYQSYRAHIWRYTDDDRCGVPEFMYNPSFSFRDYVEWALDVPMYFISRDNNYIAAHGLPFRRFLEEGYQGHHARMGDFELHLSTLFPEVRMKRYIEVRCCDGGPVEHILALPALWKGLLYNTTSRNGAKNLLSSRGDEHRQLFEVAAKEGIHAQGVEGHSMQELAIELLTLAQQGLDRLAKETNIPSESIYLEPLLERITLPTPYSYADILRDAFIQTRGERSELLPKFNLLS